jgi:hypothetical protein
MTGRGMTNSSGHPLVNNRNPSTVPSKKHRFNPDPNLTLVVYNMKGNRNINNIIEQLHFLCKIYSTEIQVADRLPSNGKIDPPIAITCINPAIKWMFIKEVNKLRFDTDTAEEFKNVFARPFLDEEQLREDRALVRKLTNIRAKHGDRSFKIFKGEIYETTNGERSLYKEEDDIAEEEYHTSLEDDEDEESVQAPAKEANPLATNAEPACPQVTGDVSMSIQAPATQQLEADDSANNKQLTGESNKDNGES